MSKEPSIKSAKPNYINIISLSGKVYDVTAISTSFSYYEDVDKPFVVATLQVIDSGLNLIKTLPMQGGEEVELEFDAPGLNGKKPQIKKVNYKFRIWKIYNRAFTAKAQLYNIALISEEAMLNEIVRITKKLSGTPDVIVDELLKKYLKTEKQVFTEKAGNNLIFYPSRKTISSIISTIQLKSRSNKATPIKPRVVENNNTEKKFESDNESADGTISGTAGYLFFENKNGFTFKSMDTICAVGTKGNFSGTDVLATYSSKAITDNEDSNNFFTIENYKFVDEIDIIENFRRGVYSTKMVFYNFSTGEYNEFNYNLKETFDSMVKLGNQDKLPEYQIQHSNYPTRVISMVVDHETWHRGESVADPEQNGNALYPDESKYMLAQGIARRNILNFQKLRITIPGNSDLVVGEKIKIYLPNMVQQSLKQKESWDKESSGNYLIAKLSHNYMMVDDTGPKMTTVLELIRDTYGMEEEPSGVK